MKPTPIRNWVIGLIVFPVLSIGCQPTQSHQSSPSNQENVGADIQKVDVDLQVADASHFEQLLKEHRGTIVVVDFWATWCPPCVAMFPHTVELANQYSSDEVVVIAVSMDDPDDEDNVREFLKKQNARFENLLSSYGVGSEGFEAFEIPNGSIPHFRVYDQAGEVVFSSDSQEGLDSRIEELMKSTQDDGGSR